MSGRLQFTLVGALASTLAVVPATAQTPILAGAGQPPSISAVSTVAPFYNIFKSQQVWFRGGVPSPAIGQMVTILRQAPIEGFAAGPQLAASVEAAVAKAASRNPADLAAADQAVSAAWVQYVQSLKRPTPGMYYAYPTLAPQGARADQILLTAAGAPSLERYVVATAAVNPIYSAIRAAALAEAQATGRTTPDQRVLANLERARTIPGSGRYVVVDIAGQRMTMFDNGQAVDSMKIIVGKSKYPTPQIASYISYIPLNPYWDSPDHLVREAIAPNVIRQGASYMKTKGYEVMADWSPTSAVVPWDQVDWKAVSAGKTHIRVRQKPGPDNFMATMKIPFVNDDDIYLHDTPTKSLFAKADRALSNGCVRLEDAPRFARWLMRGPDPVAGSTEPEQHIKLPQSVPVYLTYLTAQPRDGKLTYTADFYGLDKAASAKIASR
jgi:murein L,D-transpeptidase YcbB/YkuD